MSRYLEWAAAVLSACLLTMPWLNPYAPGASAAFGPIVVGWVCLAGWLALTPWRVSPAMWSPLALAVAIVARGPWDVSNLGPAVAGLAVVLASIGFGAAGVRGFPRTVTTVVVGLLAAALISAALALFQYFDLDRFLIEPLGLFNQTSPGEAFGNLRQRNHLATLLSMGLACMLWCVARLGLRARHAWWMLALLMAGSAASSSRTGLVQIAMVAAMGFCWRASLSPLAKRLLWAAPALYVAAWMSETALGHSLLGGAIMRFDLGGEGCSSRLVLWRNVLELIAARPWIGWGWGELDFAHFAVLYSGPRFCAILDNAHDFPLHLAVELGLPVAVLFCAVAAGACWRAKPWRETDATRQMAWAVLCAIALHSMLEYPLWYGYFQMAFGLCLGMVWPGRARHATARRNDSATDAQPARGRWHGAGWRCAGATVVLCLLGAVVLDYMRMNQPYLAGEQRWPEYRDDTLNRVRNEVWLFTRQVDFADITTRTIDARNATDSFVLASRMLHFSPESSVIEQAIRAARFMGRQDLVDFLLQRYRAAFPDAAAAFMLNEPGAAISAPVQMNPLETPAVAP